jgi:hypothetical protein
MHLTRLARSPTGSFRSSNLNNSKQMKGDEHDQAETSRIAGRDVLRELRAGRNLMKCHGKYISTKLVYPLASILGTGCNFTPYARAQMPIRASEMAICLDQVTIREASEPNSSSADASHTVYACSQELLD